MLKLYGVNIPGHLPVNLGLTLIYGIGHNNSIVICNKLTINPLLKIDQLSNYQIALLIKEIRKYSIEADLKKLIKSNINQLILIGSYRGLRHKNGFPVRGQRTRSNAKTQKFLSKKFLSQNKAYNNINNYKLSSKNKNVNNNKIKK